MRWCIAPYSILAILGLALSRAASAPGLALTLDHPITDPGAFDVIGSDHGDLRSMDHCRLPNGADIAVKRDFETFGDQVIIHHRGVNRVVSIPDAAYWGSDLVAMDCDPRRSQWFYGHPGKGTVTAYSATGAALWEFKLDPFNSIPSKPITSMGDLVGKHVITALQVRGTYVLVEWSEFRIGRNFALLTSDGKLIEQFGPSTFSLRTAGTGENWELLWGISPLPTSFIPLALYTLKVIDNPDAKQKPTAVIAGLKASANPDKRIAVRVTRDPLLDHVVALLWTPTTRDTVDFCPIVPAEGAKIWLGADYDPTLAKQAKKLLLSLWIALEEEYGSNPDGPFDGLFRERAKTDPELARLLSHVAPMSPTWDAAFRPKALAILEALPETRQLAASAAR